MTFGMSLHIQAVTLTVCRGYTSFPELGVDS